MKKLMSDEDLEKLMEYFNSYVDYRIEEIYLNLRKNKKYMMIYNKYNYKYDNLMKKYNDKDIKALKELFINIQDMESSMIYLQGLQDGMNLKENMETK